MIAEKSGTVEVRVFLNEILVRNPESRVAAKLVIHFLRQLSSPLLGPITPSALPDTLAEATPTVTELDQALARRESARLRDGIDVFFFYDTITLTMAVLKQTSGSAKEDLIVDS